MSTAAANTDISMSFDYIYQGGTGTIPLLKISILNPALGANVSVFNTSAFSSGTSISNLSIAGSGAFFNANGAGNYTFEIAVLESTGTITTANVGAGFDNITLSSTASVPFDFNPSAGIAILGASYGLNKLRKNLKAKKDTIV